MDWRWGSWDSLELAPFVEGHEHTFSETLNKPIQLFRWAGTFFIQKVAAAGASNK